MEAGDLVTCQERDGLIIELGEVVNRSIVIDTLYYKIRPLKARWKSSKMAQTPLYWYVEAEKVSPYIEVKSYIPTQVGDLEDDL